MFKKINRKNKKGFTLAELLIVVAIIGVLVAVSIPIFTSQLEKSREATDLANIRSAYAEASAALLSEEGTTTATSNLISTVTYTKASGDGKGTNAAKATVEVTLKQTVAGWVTADHNVAGVDLADPVPGKCTITVSADPNTAPTFAMS